MDLKEEIIGALTKAVAELVPDGQTVVSLQEPKDKSHGDYATNIALILSKKLKKNPLDVAKNITTLLQDKYQIKSLEKVEAVAPGFINFYLSTQILFDTLRNILDTKDTFGKADTLKKKKIMVEFTDPNPFKELHIGHLYSNTIGESLCRLLESQGGDVWRVCYQGDVGLHVAKAIYGIQNSETRIQNFGDKSSKEKAEFLGKAYARGAKAYEEDEEAKKEINTINKKVYEKSDPEINAIYEKGRAWSLEYFETIYKRVGTTFKHLYFESVAGPVGLELVKKHIQDGIFVESQGAVIFPGEKYGLHNRVFINSIGLPTYEAKDMGLPQTKYKDFAYEESIIITANEQNAYFDVVMKALSLVNPDLAVKTKHIGHGMVRLPSGKMSSRTGDVITGSWLLDEAKNRIQKAYPKMDAQTSEMVAIGAIKYALLKGGIGRDIAFSFDESISLEGNSGPYLQYTYARTQSVVRKAQSSKLKAQINTNEQKLEIEELDLLRIIQRFPDVVSEAAEKYSPNTICTYLFELSQSFNLFYQKHKILESDQREFRLALTEATGQVIKNGLNLLGIQAPEKM